MYSQQQQQQQRGELQENQTNFSLRLKFQDEQQKEEEVQKEESKEQQKQQDKIKKKVGGIQWAEDTIDNEHMNKLKSKVCCQFHGDSSSDTCTSDDEGNKYDRDRITKKNHKQNCSKNHKHKHHHHHNHEHHH